MNIINKLIPADQLHWCDEEKRYCAASKEEIMEVLSLCSEMTLEEKVVVVTRYQDFKASFLLWNNFLEGKIEIGVINEDGDVGFAPIDLS